MNPFVRSPRVRRFVMTLGMCCGLFVLCLFWLVTGSVTVQSVHAVTINPGAAAPTITVIKELNPSSDGGLFILSIDGVATSGDVGDGGTLGPTSIVSGTVYTVSESAGSVTNLADYNSSIACTVNGTPTFSGPTSSLGGISGQDGDTIVCTITNTRKTGTIEVKKTLVPSTDGGEFDLLIDGTVEQAAAQDGGTTGVVTVNTGTHSVSEQAASGTTATYYDATYSCTRNGAADSSGTGTIITGISVSEGDAIVCAFTNTLKPSTIQVAKIVNPITNSGKFNLLVNGAVEATDAGNGDSTGLSP